MVGAKNIEVLGAPRGSQSRKCEEAPNGIRGQEFVSGSRQSSGYRGNGVRSCGSDPAFHAQESQDVVNSQANSPKLSDVYGGNNCHLAFIKGGC